MSDLTSHLGMESKPLLTQRTILSTSSSLSGITFQTAASVRPPCTVDHQVSTIINGSIILSLGFDESRLKLKKGGRNDA